MEVSVMILNVLDWSKGDKSGSTLVYLICGKDYFESSEKYLGYSTITNFYPTQIRNKIPSKAIGIPLKGKLSTKRSLKDPTITYSKLESITFDNETISLL